MVPFQRRDAHKYPHFNTCYCVARKNTITTTGESKITFCDAGANQNYRPVVPFCADEPLLKCGYLYASRR